MERLRLLGVKGFCILAKEVNDRGTAGTQHFWALPLLGDRKPVEVVPATPNTFAKLPPNGRWLAHTSNETGSEQSKWQVSADGGVSPSWSHDGKELYYIDANNSIYSVAVTELAGALQLGAPQTKVNSWSMPRPFYQLAPTTGD